MVETKASSDEHTSTHMYFAVPANGSLDEFSGQYLRLEDYIGTEEDTHLPSGVSTSGLKGISLSSTGVYLVNVDNKMVETFGGALVEKVKGGDHTLTMVKGDWSLNVKDGSVTIEATNTTSDATIEFETDSCDMYIHAWWGKVKVSDSRDIKTSDSKKVTYVQLFEYSSIFGTNIKENSSFSFGFNVVGDGYFKGVEAKGIAFPLKIILTSGSLLVLGVKVFQALTFKMAMNVRKSMLIYNKRNCWQWYIEMLASKNAAVKSDMAALVDKSAYVAKMQNEMAGCGFFQKIKM